MLRKQEPGSLGSIVRASDRKEGQGDTAGSREGQEGVLGLDKPRSPRTAWATTSSFH